jgi:hypothetical protein
MLLPTNQVVLIYLAVAALAEISQEFTANKVVLHQPTSCPGCSSLLTFFLILMAESQRTTT